MTTAFTQFRDNRVGSTVALILILALANGISSERTARAQSAPILSLSASCDAQAQRVYHIGFQATDSGGAACTGTVTVCVPHDQSGRPCVDEGALFKSTGPC